MLGADGDGDLNGLTLEQLNYFEKGSFWTMTTQDLCKSFTALSMLGAHDTIIVVTSE